MSNKSRRIKALEKRIAALEAKQAQPVWENVNRDLAKAVIKEVNQQTAKAGKPLLLM